MRKELPNRNRTGIVLAQTNSFPRSLTVPLFTEVSSFVLTAPPTALCQKEILVGLYYLRRPSAQQLRALFSHHISNIPRHVPPFPTFYTHLAMSSTLRNFRLGVAVLMFGVFYQSWLKEVLFEVIGVGRVIQPIEDFPYKCRRINHERLEACEDLWLDDQERALYLACSGTESRIQWNPAIGGLNVSGRRPGGSELMAMNIDLPGTSGMFGIHGIEPVGYDGATGDGTLDLLGFDVEVVDAATLRFWLINHRPPVDANKKILDATKAGANSTIDVFELKRGKDKMVHVKTVFDREVKTPNNIAAMGDGSFVATNDHSAKGETLTVKIGHQLTLLP